MGCCSPPGRNRTALSRDQCHPQENEHAGAFLLTAERLGPVDSAVGTGYSLPVPRLDETQPQGTDERSSRFRGLRSEERRVGKEWRALWWAGEVEQKIKIWTDSV